MGDQQVYSIKVSGPGIELEREVPREVGDQIVVMALTGVLPSLGEIKDLAAAQAPAGRELAPKAAGLLSATVSIRDFMLDVLARRNPDKITAIGRYLKLYCGQDSFSEDDLVDMFSAAAEPFPKNLPRDLKWAIRAGWIAQQPGQGGRYYITNPGIMAVDQHFPREVVEKTRLPVKARQESRRG